MRNLAILVVSYDGYSDLWNDFFNLIELHWKDSPYKIYLANNTKKFERKNVFVINCGEAAQWSTRVRTALQCIKEKYVCLLLEDSFIYKDINTENVEKLVEKMGQDGLLYYKLSTFSKIKTPYYQDSNFLRTIPKDLEYGVSLQAAIWEKDFLNNLIGEEDYNAWRFEAEYHQDNSKIDYDKCVYDERDVLNICHGVVQGKFLPDAIKKMRSVGYELDTTKRAVLTPMETLVYKAKGFLSEVTSGAIKRTIKKIAGLFGVKTVLDKNKK